MKLTYLVLGCALSGCASSASEIAPSYISPVVYKDYSCAELGMEAQRISARASEAAGAVDQNASGDKWKTAAAIVVFWPAAFFIKGDGAKAQEYARLKGQLDAVEQVSIQKKCSLQIQRHEPGTN